MHVRGREWEAGPFPPAALETFAVPERSMQHRLKNSYFPNPNGKLPEVFEQESYLIKALY